MLGRKGIASACNKNTLTKSENVTAISEMTIDDRRILAYRVGVSSELETICAHNSVIYFKRYSDLKPQRWCCDPFIPHRHTSKTNVIGKVIVKLHVSDAYFNLTQVIDSFLVKSFAQTVPKI